jgi:site-specific DNA-cytosine methylase
MQNQIKRSLQYGSVCSGIEAVSLAWRPLGLEAVRFRYTPNEPGTVEGSQWRVRRLMPVECERLQGMPDDYTCVPYRGKPATDGPRYKAIGNSMAVPCVAWIGRRLQQVLQ